MSTAYPYKTWEGHQKQYARWAFGENLSALIRGKYGWGGQATFAAELGLPLCRIRRWTEGTTEPTLYWVRRLAQHLEISIEELINPVERPHR